MSEANDESVATTPRDPTQSGVATMPSLRRGDEDAAGDTVDLLTAVRTAASDRYHRVEQRASGGMGSVHVVRDAPLLRTLALKVHHDHLSTRRDHVEMFLREARLTGQLDHPHVVPVHDIGVENDRLYFTMKLVEGRTLLEWVRSFGTEFPDREELLDILDVVIKVCDALAFAHSRGVLHCDVKPANVMVGEFGQVYLMDWGVARLIDEERARPKDEDTDNVVGTPTHMCPEQARGAPLDERADVFAVGALLYHVLTGRPPFRGDSHVQVLAQSFLCRYPHPDEVRGPGVVPTALTRIVLKAMAKDPAERHQSIIELKDDLLRFARGGESFEAVEYAAGDVVVAEGEEGDTAFIIEEGRCEVLKGEERIRVMGPGEVFGEMAILSPGLRTATVRAIERSVLRKVSETILREELASMKPWMGALVRALADRFREREEEGRPSFVPPEP
ncbi:MAG: protein kinase [Sandaracinaceae bacterium]|nr:protein kinase [Sandaracinaceae bacterium]